MTYNLFLARNASNALKSILVDLNQIAIYNTTTRIMVHMNLMTNFVIDIILHD